jgi:hypothetical protein
MIMAEKLTHVGEFWQLSGDLAGQLRQVSIAAADRTSSRQVYHDLSGLIGDAMAALQTGLRQIGVDIEHEADTQDVAEAVGDRVRQAIRHGGMVPTVPVMMRLVDAVDALLRLRADFTAKLADRVAAGVEAVRRAGAMVAREMDVMASTVAAPA